MNMFFNLLTTIVITSIPVQAFGRWSTFEEAKRIYQVDSESVKINKDGTSVTEYRCAFLVNTEASRQDLNAVKIDYDSATEKIDDVEVRIKHGAEQYLVPKNLIQDQPDNSENLGFNNARIIKIALPNLKIGSVIGYKFKRTRNQPAMKGIYNDTFSFGYSATLKGASVTLASEIPLQFKVYAPEKLIRVDTSRTGKTYNYSFTLLKDSYFRTTNESEHENWSQNPTAPIVQVTSLKDWHELADQLNSRLEGRLNEDMPKRYDWILSKAKNEKSFNEKIDALTVGLNQELRYMGDWRSSVDYYVPRSLSDTAERGLGDCKDFALALTKLARQLGYKAHFAVIYRGDQSFEPMALPMLSHFNHAISRVEDEHGGIHWIDPTNILSNAQHVNRDIAGRSVLSISEETHHLETTPAETPESNVFKIDLTYSHQKNRLTTVESKLFASGEFAKNLIRKITRMPERRRREYILDIFASGQSLIQGDYKITEISKNILRPVEIGSTVEVTQSLIETTAGFGFPVARDFDDFLRFSVTDMVLGVKIGEIGTQIFKTTYNDAVLVGTLPNDCSLDSKWISATRKFKASDNLISVERILVTKNPYVSNDELKSQAFSELRERLRECLSDRMLIYKKVEK